MKALSQIGAAVIGSGFIGTVHIEALRRIGVQVHGLLGSSAGTRRGSGADAGRATRLRELGRAAGRPAVEVVHVTSPNHLHFPQTKADPGRGPARHLRKAAGDVVRRDRRAGPIGGRFWQGRGGQLQPALLPAQPARAAAGARRRRRQRPTGQRALLPGLASHGDRLELAPPARSGGRPARGGRHRLALARPHVVHHRAYAWSR